MHLASSKNTLAISEQKKQQQQQQNKKKNKKKKTDTFLLRVPILYNEGACVIDVVATKRILRKLKSSVYIFLRRHF